jgi:hypothetical protein
MQPKNGWQEGRRSACRTRQAEPKQPSIFTHILLRTGSTLSEWLRVIESFFLHHKKARKMKVQEKLGIEGCSWGADSIDG